MSVIVRSACAALAVSAAMLGSAATAMADEPNCTAADLAGITGGVSTAVAAYLFTHPDVNGFLTGLKDLPKPERQAQIRSYMDANQQVKDELGAKIGRASCRERV